ncbi:MULTISPECIES: helix-turn-helix transcriptional regulator [Pseudomonas]|jgi:prophage regulatory protein|uniref:AlpA family phage regulatory protein n=2 Tax=Pseudomonas TaxID=286 RepID=A0A5C5QEW0_9PSED|nr:MULTISPECIES: AlpA family phage regulatory protein [Pseudomonas]MDD0973201.1 AlpA family phage regulatory protein [Pseudomonas fontis]MDD0989667.1 AlpA family phage regulatory protein [Pseudomonas fontis]TWS03811.1 AlpA family phage regulatory protein [Pseudomonas extremaustralis]SDG24516.1 transcriptional regulator, AlpA family [Pseudomonas extremaustralis]
MEREDERTAIATSDAREAVLRIKQVIGRLGVARSTIYDWMNPRSPRHDQEFPLPIRLSSVTGRGAIGWLESDICRWIESRLSVVPGGGGGRNV